MYKIYAVTQAYNAEATIGRAIQSVLAQTYPVIRYYILDSASTDNTMDIINEYAKSDNRIVPLHNDYNSYTAFIDLVSNIAEESEEEKSVLAILDADDVYHPDAFEKLLSFMSKNDLDMVAGGYDIFSAETDKKTRSFCVKENVVYRKDNYCWYFPAYYSHVGTVWGKLFLLKVLRKCDFSKAKSIVHGADTAFVMEVIKNSDSFGIISDAICNYYYSYLSMSNQLSESRLMGARTAFDIGFSFLSAYGDVGSHNRKFLLMVYFNCLRAVIYLVNNGNCGSKRTEYIRRLFDDPLTEEAFLLEDISNKEKYDLMYTILNYQ